MDQLCLVRAFWTCVTDQVARAQARLAGGDGVCHSHIRTQPSTLWFKQWCGAIVRLEISGPVCRKPSASASAVGESLEPELTLGPVHIGSARQAPASAVPSVGPVLFHL